MEEGKYIIGHDPISKSKNNKPFVFNKFISLLNNSSIDTGFYKSIPSNPCKICGNEMNFLATSTLATTSNNYGTEGYFVCSCKKELQKLQFKNFLGFGRKEKGLFWFRFKHNNKGFHIKNTKNHPLLFSERINKTGFSIGNWHFKWLKKYEG